MLDLRIEQYHRFGSEESSSVEKTPILEIGWKSYLFITNETRHCLCS